MIGSDFVSNHLFEISQLFISTAFFINTFDWHWLQRQCCSIIHLRMLLELSTCFRWLERMCCAAVSFTVNLKAY